MKSFFKFLAVFFGVLLLSAVLAPVLHDYLPYKFGRIFNRLVMILSLAAVLIFVRVRREDFVRAGLFGYPGAARLFFICFAAGIAVLTALLCLKTVFKVEIFRLVNLPAKDWALRIAKDLSAAVLIACVEETFFRGFVFTKLKNVFRGRIAVPVLITSFFYSLVHFISDKKPFIGPDPQFWDSIRLMTAPFSSLAEWPSFWPAAAGLFLFGIVLNAVSIRTGSLYAPIGLHAGCVFFVKLDGLFADSFNTPGLLWGTTKMYDGIMGWVFLAVLGFVLSVFLKNQSLEKRSLNLR